MLLNLYQNNLHSFEGSLPYLNISAVEVGQHLYWELGAYRVHGQVFIVTWLVMAVLLAIAFLGTRNLKRIPEAFQNFMEYLLEFLQDIAKNQIGEHEYRTWVYQKVN